MTLLKTLLARVNAVADAPSSDGGRLIQELAALAALPEVLPTNEAASLLNRSAQTLRKWACYENGPIRPIRINGRLAWRIADIQALLQGTEA